MSDIDKEAEGQLLVGKLWGSRFKGKLNALMESFNNSIKFDQRLWEADIIGSIAYAKALTKIKLLTETERDEIIATLKSISDEWRSGKFEINTSTDEDIHTANERRLKELIGSEIGGKLHTGRSRNEQTVLDLRIWLENACKDLKFVLVEFITTLLERAETETRIVMPGYTHLQRAQPVLWSHWLLSHAVSLQTDLERLHQVLHRTMMQCPLGSGAVAGSPFPLLDRQEMAKDLGFLYPSLNSMQAVGDRDFVAEFQFWASLTAVHLSKLSEDLIIFSTQEFGFVTIADEYSTGSSLMPQKKNADSLELIRGKSARIIGNCTGILVMLKGLPSTYSKDLQEDKEALFETFDTIKIMLQIGNGVTKSLAVNEAKCTSALTVDMMATEVAYYLVRRGVSFRDAHGLAGRVVSMGEDRGVEINQLTLSELKTLSEKFQADIADIWCHKASVAQYASEGGTSESSVRAQINQMKNIMMTYNSTN